MEVPTGFRKMEAKDIEILYKIPPELEVPEVWGISMEILDDIFSGALGVHILEPVVEYRSYWRAKGIPPKVNVENLPPIHERSSSMFKKSRKVPSSPQLRNRSQPRSSEAIRLTVARANQQDRPIYQECAAVLSEVLNKICNERTNKIRTVVASSEKRIVLQKDLQQAEQDAIRRRRDEILRKRRVELDLELANAKQERELKLKEAEENKRQQLEQQKRKRQILADKSRKEREIKEDMIKKWVEERKAVEEQKKRIEKAK